MASLPCSPTDSTWPCHKSEQAPAAAVALRWLLPTLLCDAWDDAASRPCSSSSCSSSSCSSVGSKLYMGMSWCRSFSNLPGGGEGKAWLRGTELRLLPHPTAEAFCRLLLLLHRDSAPVAGSCWMKLRTYHTQLAGVEHTQSAVTGINCHR